MVTMEDSDDDAVLVVGIANVGSSSHVFVARSYVTISQG
jgi:hypothetical protein